MANAVRTKIERLSGQRTAKVKEIREFEAKLRKPGLSDAETKKINIIYIKTKQLNFINFIIYSKTPNNTYNTNYNYIFQINTIKNVYLNPKKPIEKKQI